MKIVHLSIIFLIIAMKAAVFFLQIYWIFRYPMPSAITSKLQLFPLISLFFLSFKRKWQVPSATVNRVLLSQIPIELSLLLNRCWKFFKKWFIHQERKTNFCPREMAESNGRLSAPWGLLVFHQMFVYTVAIYLSISDDVDASSIDQKYM